MRQASQLASRLIRASSSAASPFTQQGAAWQIFQQFHSAISLYSDDGNTPPATDAPVKKRRGRPPKQPKTEQPETVVASSTDADPPVVEAAPAPVVEAPAKVVASNNKPKAAKQPKLPTPIRHMDPTTLLQTNGAIIDKETDIQWHSGLSINEVKDPSSTAALNQYVDIPTDIPLAEATADFYKDPLLAEERVKQPNYGCKAVEDEFAFTASRSLLFRSSWAELIKSVASRSSPQLYLDGWTGSGKSVALYSLVAWARTAGYIVMYIPNAIKLVNDGRFYRDEGTEEQPGDDLWDTPECAQSILKSVMNAHGDVLKTLKTRDGSMTLAELAQQGIDTAHDTLPKTIVQACIALKDELLSNSTVPTLVVVDNYNALYSTTEYYEPVHAHHSRRVSPDEVRMVRGFRVLEQDASTVAPGNLVIAAPSYSASISPHIRLPKSSGSRVKTVTMPRFAVEEVAVVAAMFADKGIVHEKPSPGSLLYAATLTNGNAKELRESGPALLNQSTPFGLSLGYKAAAVVRKAYNLRVPDVPGA